MHISIELAVNRCFEVYEKLNVWVHADTILLYKGLGWSQMFAILSDLDTRDPLKSRNKQVETEEIGQQLGAHATLT